MFSSPAQCLVIFSVGWGWLSRCGIRWLDFVGLRFFCDSGFDWGTIDESIQMTISFWQPGYYIWESSPTNRSWHTSQLSCWWLSLFWTITY